MCERRVLHSQARVLYGEIEKLLRIYPQITFVHILKPRPSGISWSLFGFGKGEKKEEKNACSGSSCIVFVNLSLSINLKDINVRPLR